MKPSRCSGGRTNAPIDEEVDTELADDNEAESPQASEKPETSQAKPTKPKTKGKTNGKKVRRSRPKSDSDSDSDVSSTPKSDKGSILSDSSTSSSSSDENEVGRMHRRQKRRRDSRRRLHKSRRFRRKSVASTDETDDETIIMPGTYSTARARGFGTKIRRGSNDVGEAIAKLELRCSQLQFQISNLTGSASHTNYSSPRPPQYGQMQAAPSFAGYPPWYSNGDQPMYISNAQSALPMQQPPSCSPPGNTDVLSGRPIAARNSRQDNVEPPQSHSNIGKEPKMSYKRVDSIWDKTIYSFKLRESAKTVDNKYDEYVFHVRRTFDADGKYSATYVDIKSKLLRECLQDVIGNVRGVNLVQDIPKLDPNMLFLYLEDFRAHLKRLEKAQPAGRKRSEQRKSQLRLDQKQKQLKVLVKYLDKDFSKTKKTLSCMLEKGIINFDNLWALWKPKTLVYSTMYGFDENPRVFKVDFAGRHTTLVRGNFYNVEGKCLEFDGKRFGYGNVVEAIDQFPGTRKITSLPFYPLSYHREESKVRQMLVERGKKYVSLGGSHLKQYSGFAYMRQKKDPVVKFHIEPSRIMVDHLMFRRINPNYFMPAVRPREDDTFTFVSATSSDEDYDAGGCFSLDNDQDASGPGMLSGTAAQEDLGSRVVILKDVLAGVQAELKETGPKAQLSNDVSVAVQGPVQALTKKDSTSEEHSTATPSEEEPPGSCQVFTDDDYLLTSPVVFGFSFSEKIWLEFSVSRICETQWNKDAWGSLVLPEETKDLIQALVKSRKTNMTRTTDDVIQGKGKGLVAVLHGPPGTGKTLTAEGISELLQCPLYMVSAGELGTNARFLEADLQKILLICHKWKALLLLDEADVFLEKRNMQDIHRNALVSVFLRQLEYFQGTMFLTTNRVETFDDAFQSRIHIALQYDGLDTKAKKTIFKMFIDRVRNHGQLVTEDFSEQDFDDLAKHELNGREIKNLIGSAQDLALNKGEPLSMRHVKVVLDVHLKFERDLKGGVGFEEAMRSYF